MNTSQNKQEKQFQDVSRFTRWINGLDEKDTLLRPQARKRKWIISLSVLFLLFVFSFIWFPPVTVKHKNLGKNPEEVNTAQNPTKANALEMPVDSFEQQLKQKIHEENPEKE
ncbi:hypothetical protein GM418_29840 [Maribellus comscasis]|uniref:Uncharacterized protein n=1 Tax=Maribellus comscasis TaxID=2681766 RepID=A0A6I6JX53_9BACT|nr:hypothetical protein [Maribellus comscasis]QGY47716.1 hypothetical protein GM418_29840 [Maribellus comscasis]